MNYRSRITSAEIKIKRDRTGSLTRYANDDDDDDGGDIIQFYSCLSMYYSNYFQVTIDAKLQMHFLHGSLPFKYEAQAALFKDPVRAAQ